MKTSKMRTLYTYASALMAACLLFTACSDKDDDSKNENPPVPATATIKYAFTIGQDYLDLIDASVTFWNDKGKQQTEPLTTTSWQKQFTLTQSQTFGYTVTSTPKANIDELLTKTSYTMGHGYLYSYWNSEGSGNQNGTDVTLEVPVKNVKAYIAKYPEIYKLSVMWDKETNTFTK